MEVKRLLESIGYQNIVTSYRSKPYDIKKKWFESTPTPVKVKTEDQLNELIQSVGKQFENSIVPYRVYRDTVESSDSEAEYEETVKYISLVQNADSKKYFVAIHPDIVKSVKCAWIPEYKLIERYPVYIGVQSGSDSEIPRYIELDCTTDKVA